MTMIFYNVLRSCTIYICTYMILVGIYFYKHGILCIIIIIQICLYAAVWYGIYVFNQIIFIKQE